MGGLLSVMSSNHTAAISKTSMILWPRSMLEPENGCVWFEHRCCHRLGRLPCLEEGGKPSLPSHVPRNMLQLNFSSGFFFSENAVHTQNAVWAVSDWPLFFFFFFFWGGFLIPLKQAFAWLSKLMARLDRTNAETPRTYQKARPFSTILPSVPSWLFGVLHVELRVLTENHMEGTGFQAYAFCRLVPRNK